MNKVQDEHSANVFDVYFELEMCTTITKLQQIKPKHLTGNNF